MRLIDADVMHREIDKYNLEGRMSLKNIKRYIDAQPTAYDINKMTKEEIVRILDLALEQSRADACNDCAFSDTEEWEEPCKRCKRNYRDYWRRSKRHD